MELGIFVFEATHIFKHIKSVHFRRKSHLICQHRFKDCSAGIPYAAYALTGVSSGKSGHSRNITCSGCLGRAEAVAGIEAYRTYLSGDFLAGSVGVFQFITHTERSAEYFQMCKTAALLVVCYLVYFCPEHLLIVTLFCKTAQHIYELINAFHFKCRAETARKYLPACDTFSDLSVRYLAVRKILFHKFVAAQCGFFGNSRYISKVSTVR